MIKRRFLISIAAALVASLLQLQIFLSPLGDRFELFMLDAFFNLRGVTEAPDDFVVLSMDESSYRVLNLPMDQAWPRSLHAQVLTRLKEYQAKRVVMDILFLGEGSNPKADQELATAIGLNPTVLAVDIGTKLEVSSAGTFSVEELLSPPEIFSLKAESLAIAKLPEDRGTVRRFIGSQSELAKTLPVLFQAAVLADFFEKKNRNPTSRDYINYYGPPGTIKTIPIHQFLNPKGAPPVSTFKDKIVFIGLNLRTELGPAQKDSFVTPFYQRGRMFGVEIQATAAANILTDNWIKRLSAFSESILILLLCFLLATAIFIFKPLWSGLTAISFIALWSALAFASFCSGLFLPGASLVCVTVPALYLISTLVYYFRTYRQQQLAERAFKMYLSPEMSRMMSTNADCLKLGGESMYATAMFTDIEGFTSITEKMTASEVSAMLNSYFTEVMNAILENKGTLIKFIGDAVFALWGAPIKEADHARLACETAIAIQKEVEKFNQSKRFPALNTRVGINTGSMVVGNLGSAKRFDYTAIGDSINIASRVEGINKYFGTSILITESANKEALGRIESLSMGQVVVSGKQQSVQLFAVFAPAIALDCKSLWESALIKFRNRNWLEAKELFSRAATADLRLTKAADLYITQIVKFESSLPAESWQGEITFESK